MQNTPSELPLALEHFGDISDLPPEKWADAVEDICEEFGYFEPLGPDHAAAFIDDGRRLLVTFSTYENNTERTKDGFPIGISLAGDKGWSTLNLIATGSKPGAAWFRAKEVIGYFDRLIDDGFFEDFDEVVFYGAGPSGYAAATFSIAAPGATVVAISPQATLESRLASWDTRFPQTRRMDFTSRFGFAPDMIEGAKQAFVLYDPTIDVDAMHAALFAQPHVTRFPLRRFGADPEYEILEMDALTPLLDAAMNDQISRATIAKIMRVRRDNMGYLRRLLSTVSPEQRPMQTIHLCNYVLKNRPHATRFKKTMLKAQSVLKSQGRDMPVPAPAKTKPVKT